LIAILNAPSAFTGNETKSFNLLHLLEKTLLFVMAGLVPAIPMRRAPRLPKRDAREKRGHGEVARKC